MELFTSMNRLNRFYVAQVNEICTTRKMTSMQFQILRYIFRYGSCTSMDIVKAWKVEKPTVSEHIRRLHDKEWIAITQGADKRVKNLALTHAGESVYEEILVEVEALHQKVTANFTEEEVAIFTRFMLHLEDELLSLD
ncbi:MAG: MarR family transcriptional regulator [Caryophanon sp.]|nr:MarR family transcriptional regulator [Caryophanon sp.]